MLLLHPLQAEFAVLMNGTGHILAAPLCPELRGQRWDPASIVSDTIAAPYQRYTRTGECSVAVRLHAAQPALAWHSATCVLAVCTAAAAAVTTTAADLSLEAKQCYDRHCCYCC
jgi:hypothetical protein